MACHALKLPQLAQTHTLNEKEGAQLADYAFEGLAGGGGKFPSASKFARIRANTPRMLSLMCGSGSCVLRCSLVTSSVLLLRGAFKILFCAVREGRAQLNASASAAHLFFLCEVFVPEVWVNILHKGSTTHT